MPVAARVADSPVTDDADGEPPFRRLYDEHVDAVFAYCLLRLGDRAAAEDAAGLIFTRALAAYPRFNPGAGSARSWHFAIAHNTLASLHRDRKPTTSLDAVRLLPSTEPSPDAAAIAREEQARLRSAVARLPTDQRTVMELRIAGLRGAEIAAATGRSLPAVKMLQRRALDRLRAILTDDPTGEPRR